MSLYDEARRYVEMGISVIPIRPDGSKRPALDTWKEFQDRKPTDAELREWFCNDLNCGIAVVCGTVSRNLEVLDFDDASVWSQFLTEHRLRLRSAKVAIVRTPSGGAHIYLFRKSAGPNRKLAMSEAGETTIEIRGQGGYALAPGCPPQCHPDGKTYEWLQPLGMDLPDSSKTTIPVKFVSELCKGA